MAVLRGDEMEKMKKMIKRFNDNNKILKNPAMGWVIYIDNFEDDFPDADVFFSEMEKPVEFSNILYIRVPWAFLEPEEGRYAWLYDENYKKLINIALKKGLQLAFLVYIASKDCQIQATPQYVRDYGASGYILEDKWSPCLDDEIYHKAFEVFIGAFAKEYDDADKTAFIDAFGVGYWGECSNFYYPPEKEKSDFLKEVFDWCISAYKNVFHNVLLGVQYQGSDFTWEQADYAIDELSYIARRNSFGSPVWFRDKYKKPFMKILGRSPVFAENCYHHVVSRTSWWMGDGFDDIGEMFDSVLNDAYESKANTLDLRVVEDANAYVDNFPEKVTEFALRCGYRFLPVEFEIVYNGSKLEIKHVWKNQGIGYLPNRKRNWDSKYKIAFMLKGENNQLIIDKEIELEELLGGETKEYLSTFENINSFDEIYLGIINEKGEKRKISLPIDEKCEDGFYYIGKMD